MGRGHGRGAQGAGFGRGQGGQRDRGLDRSSGRNRESARSGVDVAGLRRFRRRSRRSRTGVAPRSRPAPVSRPSVRRPAIVARLEIGATAAKPRLRAAHRRTGTSRGAKRPAELGPRLGPARRSGSRAAAAPQQPDDLFAPARLRGFGAGSGSAAPAACGAIEDRAAQPGARSPGETLLVANPKFKLQYAVDDAGPSGPATVELWITQDGGRTWIRRGDDEDRVSPIEVDLGGEGTFGLCLVARSASGLGDQPPAPGDPPQTWVEVDSTAPVVQIQPPQDRHRRERRQGRDRLAGQRPSSAAQVGHAFLAPRSARRPLAERSPTASRTPASSSGTFRRQSPSGST